MKRRAVSLMLTLAMLLSLGLPPFSVATADEETTETTVVTGEEESNEETEAAVMAEDEGKKEAAEDSTVAEDDEKQADEDGSTQDDQLENVILAEISEEETDQPESLVRVRFVCDPENAVITVFDRWQLDEEGAPLVIEAEKDDPEKKVYLLEEGTYLFDAIADGFINIEKEEFVVEKPDSPNQEKLIIIFLEELVNAAQSDDEADEPDDSFRGAEAFEITVQPEDVEAEVGDTVTFHVEATGSDLTYQWQYSTNGIAWSDCKAAGYNTNTFSFTMQAKFNGRQYRCVITDGTGIAIESNAAFLTIADQGLAVDEVNFPDINFRNYVGQTFDLDSNGFLSNEEIEAIVSIDCSSQNIASLTGIEYFTMLNTLAASNNALTTVDLSHNAALVSFVFSGNTSLTDVVFPSGITAITDNAFKGCTNLTEITIPNSVTVIGESAFQDCSALVTVTVSNDVTRIGKAAFKDCKMLKSIRVFGKES